jgi:hypothetical protein
MNKKLLETKIIFIILGINEYSKVRNFIRFFTKKEGVSQKDKKIS